jgi:hypothetical protein
VSGYLALFQRPLVRAFALVVLAAVTVLPSFFLVGALSKVPPPPVAGLGKPSDRDSVLRVAAAARGLLLA